MARLFLAQSRAPVLVMADTDMAFTAEHVGALVALTEKAAVVGARYRGMMPGIGRPDRGSRLHRGR
jgi:hypothetical protein